MATVTTSADSSQTSFTTARALVASPDGCLVSADGRLVTASLCDAYQSRHAQRWVSPQPWLGNASGVILCSKPRSYFQAETIFAITR